MIVLRCQNLSTQCNAYELESAHMILKNVFVQLKQCVLFAMLSVLYPSLTAGKVKLIRIREYPYKSLYPFTPIPKTGHV